jgi:hypothetical protein
LLSSSNKNVLPTANKIKPILSPKFIWNKNQYS